VARRLLHYILSTESVAQSGAKDLTDSLKAARPALNITQQPRQESKPSEGSQVPKLSTTKPSELAQGSREVILPRMPAAPKVVSSEAKRDSPTAKQEPADVKKHSTELIAKALQIISEESGIANEELTDSSVLADVGIDSLLSLMISSRFRDELAVEIDSAAFCDLPTIKELKDFLVHAQDGPGIGNVPEVDLVPNSEDKGDHRHSNELPLASHASIPIEYKHEVQSVPSLESDSQETSSSAEGVFAQVLQIVSEETGIAVAEFPDDSVFADAGIDSLLSLMISSRLRDELGVEVGGDAALFTTCPTVRDLRTHLTPVDVTKTGAALANSSSVSLDSLTTDSGSGTFSNDSNTSEGFVDEDYIEIAKPSTQSRRATSIILQGRPWMSSKTLFLFPDGAGSASSYANLPKIHSDMAVIGLNCPYVRHPQEMTCSLDELLKSYLDEVRRRQPHGPYNFGGWSAGGILAYRATQILIQEGEKVENLVLIDTPVPKGLDRLPQRFYDHCNSIGLFGKAMPGPSPSPPAQLFAHFDAIIDVLNSYHAKSLPPGHLRKVTIIWATECVMDGVHFPKLPPGPDDTEGMKFLTEQRTDFTAAGWEKLFPGAVIDIKRVEGAHHFSLMVSFFPFFPF
jgi:acyl carrier protein/pimeloyl-ACP methyl ester carboxylesterase